ncbi:MAG: hypothetical protein sometimes fused to ribosomal protein S6 glutaminyl transferase, partial [uncultured Nocardioides sp.]
GGRLAGVGLPAPGRGAVGQGEDRHGCAVVGDPRVRGGGARRRRGALGAVPGPPVAARRGRRRGGAAAGPRPPRGAEQQRAGGRAVRRRDGHRPRRPPHHDRDDAQQPRRDGLPDAHRTGGPRAGLPGRLVRVLRRRPAEARRAPEELGPL